MPFRFHKENDGEILAVQIHGNVTKDDYVSFVAKIDQEITKQEITEQGKPLILFDMTDLQGWDAGVVWEDLKFGVNHFDSIQRIAVVGDNVWQHIMTLLGKPFTKAAMHYFDSKEMGDARRWLAEE